MNNEKHIVPTAQQTHFPAGERGNLMNATARFLKGSSIAAIAFASAIATGHSAFAAGSVDNTATANGTPARGSFTAPTDDASVDLEDATRTMSIVKTVDSVTIASGADSGIVDAGDTITYRYVITNTGSATLTDVTPTDAGPDFNGAGRTNSLSGFTFDSGASTAASAASVAPGETAVFTATYTMSATDYLQGSQVSNGADNTASATANETLTTAVTPDTVEYDIPANPAMTVVKTAALTEVNGNTGDGLAAAGDTILYTYTVTNTGNVPISNVTISDLHEGTTTFLSTVSMLNETLSSDGPLAPGIASDTGTANDGQWDLLQPGAIITFTYSHTVTQTEFDAQ